MPGLPGRRRQGLFTQPGEEEQLEFGYCFDVSSPSNPCPHALTFPLPGRHKSLRPNMGISLRDPIPPHAANRQQPLVSSDSPSSTTFLTPAQGLPPLRQLPLPPRLHLLLHNHVPRVQRPALLAPHRAAARAHRHPHYPLVRVTLRAQLAKTPRSGSVGGLEAQEGGITALSCTVDGIERIRGADVWDRLLDYASWSGAACCIVLFSGSWGYGYKGGVNGVCIAAAG